jgi:peptidylprolyl isomerase
MKKLFLAGCALVVFSAPVLAASSMTVETNIGCSFTIAFKPEVAPKHVAQVAKLAAAGTYDNVVFHRVIDGFMAQTGDVQNGKQGANLALAGTGGSSEPDLPAEFSKEHFGRGTVGMARSANPNSANSQFFVMFADGGFLDGQYTVFGQVDDAGMACVDKIKKGDQSQNGTVSDAPDFMTKVTVQ